MSGRFVDVFVSRSTEGAWELLARRQSWQSQEESARRGCEAKTTGGQRYEYKDAHSAPEMTSK